jgi:hypothetical protein
LVALSSSHFDPNVWSGRALQEVLVNLADAVLHQCIRPLIGACCAPGHHGYQRAFELISGQASNGAIWVTSVRMRREDRSSIVVSILSQTSAGKGVGYVIDRFLTSPCSFVRAWRSFLRPGLRAQTRRAQGAVKAGRRSVLTSCSTAARPRLDGPEHGARIKQAGTPPPRS